MLPKKGLRSKETLMHQKDTRTGEPGRRKLLKELSQKTCDKGKIKTPVGGTPGLQIAGEKLGEKPAWV